jgi:hypothetical protein
MKARTVARLYLTTSAQFLGGVGRENRLVERTPTLSLGQCLERPLNIVNKTYHDVVDGPLPVIAMTLLRSNPAIPVNQSWCWLWRWPYALGVTLSTLSEPDSTL